MEKKSHNFKPVSTLLIVEPGKVDEVTKGGIIVPESARRSLYDGTILAIGPMCNERYKVGDKIVFSKSSEYKLEVDDEVIFVVEEVNILLHESKPPPKAIPLS